MFIVLSYELCLMSKGLNSGTCVFFIFLFLGGKINGRLPAPKISVTKAFGGL